MSSGGGTTTTTQNTVSTKELPAWLEDAAQRNIARANMVADIGYTPYYGLDTAGFSPMQTSGFQNTANAAAAFGLGAPTDVNAYMPQTTTNNLGFTGYSSGNAFDEALGQLAANRPAQYQAIQNQFVNPVTGTASVPTAMNVLTDPNSTADQMQAIMGVTSSKSGDGNYYDPTADTRTPFERYQDMLNWGAGEAGWVQDAIGGVSPVFSSIIDSVNKAGTNSWLDKYGVQDNPYGVVKSGDGYTTTNEQLAKNMGWTYNKPSPTPVFNTSGSTYSSGGNYYASNPFGGGDYTSGWDSPSFGAGGNWDNSSVTGGFTDSQMNNWG